MYHSNTRTKEWGNYLLVDLELQVSGKYIILISVLLYKHYSNKTCTVLEDVYKNVIYSYIFYIVKQKKHGYVFSGP